MSPVKLTWEWTVTQGSGTSYVVYYRGPDEEVARRRFSDIKSVGVITSATLKLTRRQVGPLEIVEANR